MSESLQFHTAESEFQDLGISYLVLEGPNEEKVMYSVTEFCGTLPTASRFAKSYGVLRVAKLIAEQLKHIYCYPFLNGIYYDRVARLIGDIRIANCWLTAFNYVLNDRRPYNLPLPYSIALVLGSQLIYGVSERFVLPKELREKPRDLPPYVTFHIPSDRTPVNATAFNKIDERSIYRDGTMPECEIKNLLATGIATLVGANLPYGLDTPYESAFILRQRRFRLGDGSIETRYTIPGGHTKIMQTKDLGNTGIYRGVDSIGYTLVDVTYIREAMEETGLPLRVFKPCRPLARADQVMWTIDGYPIRYLSYIGQTPIWSSDEGLLKNADDQGDWEVFGPFGHHDIDGADIHRHFQLVPVAEVALRFYRI
jgi:8-oxo-dGTP pyrophosphatase MutT (NUDIX family)